MAKRVKQPHGGEIKLLEKGETANPNGRPPKVFSAIVKQWKEAGFEPATPTRVREAYEYLLSLPMYQVIEIAGKNEDKSNDLPALLRIVAKEMLGKRGKEMITEMLDRAHGKAKQQIDATSDGKQIGTFTGLEFFRALSGDGAKGEGVKQEGRPEGDV